VQGHKSASTSDPSSLREIISPRVCIVRLLNGLQAPQINSQVVFDPARVSGDYVRIEGPGNDLHGWFRLEDLTLVRVVGIPSADGKGWTALHEVTAEEAYRMVAS
jgi:hypothetical protein